MGYRQSEEYVKHVDGLKPLIIFPKYLINALIIDVWQGFKHEAFWMQFFIKTITGQILDTANATLTKRYDKPYFLIKVSICFVYLQKKIQQITSFYLATMCCSLDFFSVILLSHSNSCTLRRLWFKPKIY